MFIPASQLPSKPYVVYAFVPERNGDASALLTLTGHVSLRAAKRGMAKARAEVGNVSALVYGWSLIEADHRAYGMVL